MSDLLVDTHALLWWLSDDPALPETARGLIGDPGNKPMISVASVWEIAIERGAGKLEAPADLLDTIRSEGFTLLPIEPEDAWAVAELPQHHRDPFDRILLSQALARGLPIITDDPRFSQYPVAIRW